MIATITNVSATLTLNKLDIQTGGSGYAALSTSGGNRLNKLPYPFTGFEVAPAGTLIRPMQIGDFRNRLGEGGHETREQLVDLIQRKLITFAVATQATVIDPEALALNTI